MGRVDFYRRLESLLARHGLRRESQQTQREFIAAAAGKFRARLGHKQANGLQRIAEAFYRVRFGGMALDSGESQAVELELAEIAAALRANGSEIRGQRKV